MAVNVIVPPFEMATLARRPSGFILSAYSLKGLFRLGLFPGRPNKLKECPCERRAY